MSDEPNANKYMGGYDDAAQFTNADPPPPKRVHAANSGRVDPHLTHYVGVEAAKELRALFEELLSNYLFEKQAGSAGIYDTPPYKNELDTEQQNYRARLNDILGLSE